MTARAQRRMLNDVKKNPRVSAKDLQKSLEDDNISVDESTVRKTLNNNGVHGKAPWKKSLLSKNNNAANLKFAKAPGCSIALLAKYSVDKLNQSCVVWKEHTTLCVEKKMHRTPT